MLYIFFSPLFAHLHDIHIIRNVVKWKMIHVWIMGGGLSRVYCAFPGLSRWYTGSRGGASIKLLKYKQPLWKVMSGQMPGKNTPLICPRCLQDSSALMKILYQNPDRQRNTLLTRLDRRQPQSLLPHTQYTAGVIRPGTGWENKRFYRHWHNVRWLTVQNQELPFQ